jgi:hypothetical protein
MSLPRTYFLGALAGLAAIHSHSLEPMGNGRIHVA